MPITQQQLLQILPNARPVAGVFVPALSAAWYWTTNKLNDPVDAGRFQDIGSLINTGKLGEFLTAPPSARCFRILP